MKKQLLFTLALLAAFSGGLMAQDINTLFFLENAPMRHTLNPAFQPVSKVYVGFTPLSNIYLSAGNNAVAMSDLIYKKDGKYITALYPGEGNKLANRLKHDLRFRATSQLALLNFGFRIKDFGYFHFGINEKIEAGIVIPGTVYDLLYTDGNMDPGGRTIQLDALALNAQVYTEFSAGYSHKINDKWTVGGKMKFLYGNGYADIHTDNTTIGMYPDQLTAKLQGSAYFAGPFVSEMPAKLDKNTFSNPSSLVVTNASAILRPKGIGSAIDLGMTYNPLKQLRISVALNDLGFVHWNSIGYDIQGDTVYTGPVVHYNELNSNTADEANNGIGAVIDTVTTYAANFFKEGITGTNNGKKGINRMTTTRLNIGIDGNFWDNRVGVGVYSSTHFTNSYVYEELTLGASLRPVNWFNLALSYSFINGRWNSMGFGLSLMPYDGINITLVTDYIPFSYAQLTSDTQQPMTIPYKMKGINAGIQINLVFGTNPKKDKAQ
ncbi:MAG: hypothetical protein IJ838_00770 [Paludibacteraceae bacterium]|nr:hypothetical protein [Paludibacteraceae bacterium]